MNPLQCKYFISALAAQCSSSKPQSYTCLHNHTTENLRQHVVLCLCSHFHFVCNENLAVAQEVIAGSIPSSSCPHAKVPDGQASTCMAAHYHCSVTVCVNG